MLLHLEENLSEDERPADWVYILPWELDKHLVSVKTKRDQKGEKDNPAEADYDTAEFSRNELVPNTWGRGS